MEKSLNKCLSLQEIELLAIDNSQLNTAVLEHFTNCPNCKSQYDELVQYYQLLQEELAQPISNSVVKFTQEIGADCIQLSVLRLHLVKNVPGVNPTFQSELIYHNIQDATFIELPEIETDDILLRLLQHHENLQGCVAVLAKEPAFYQNVKLFFQELQLLIPVDTNGLGKIEAIKPESLAEQIVKIIPHHLSKRC